MTSSSSVYYKAAVGWKVKRTRTRVDCGTWPRILYIQRKGWATMAMHGCSFVLEPIEYGASGV